MSDAPFPPERDEDFLAADYALGTLPAADMRRVERRLRADPVFAAEVASWQARLSPMIDVIEPRTVPADVWRDVEAQLPDRSTSTRAPVASGVVAEGRRRVAAFWQWLAIGSTGLAAASIAGLLLVSAPSFQQDTTGMLAHTAAITSDADGVPLFAVVLDPATDSATLVPIRLENTAGRVPELWLVREGSSPQSLGVIDPEAPLRISIAPDMMEGDLSGGQLAISMEPEGGSPTGQPTGPVVGHGALRSI